MAVLASTGTQIVRCLAILRTRRTQQRVLALNTSRTCTKETAIPTLLALVSGIISIVTSRTVLHALMLLNIQVETSLTSCAVDIGVLAFVAVCQAWGALLALLDVSIRAVQIASAI